MQPTTKERKIITKKDNLPDIRDRLVRIFSTVFLSIITQIEKSDRHQPQAVS